MDTAERTPKEKNYRFFFHYNKHHKCMTVHFRGKCVLAKNGLECHVFCEDKINKRQPYVVMQGFCREVIEEPNRVVIK